MNRLEIEKQMGIEESDIELEQEGGRYQPTLCRLYIEPSFIEEYAALGDAGADCSEEEGAGEAKGPKGTEKAQSQEKGSLTAC